MKNCRRYVSFGDFFIDFTDVRRFLLFATCFCNFLHKLNMLRIHYGASPTKQTHAYRAGSGTTESSFSFDKSNARMYNNEKATNKEYPP